MDAAEVRKLAELEDRHWWYRERRTLLAGMIRGLDPGLALDVGAAGGGNTRVLRQNGWRAAALEYGDTGAAICASREVPVIRGDATRLPVSEGSLDLVTAFDVLEHIDDDTSVVADVYRALRPGGTFLVAVPCDPRLWSAHDEAVGHVRRYTRPELENLVSSAGFEIQDVHSWMVLLRPLVAMRRRTQEGSSLDEPAGWLNAALGAVVSLERVLPVGRLPGVSLFLRARRP
jgi:SAM-dependent methyltransferase